MSLFNRLKREHFPPVLLTSLLSVTVNETTHYKWSKSRNIQVTLFNRLEPLWCFGGCCQTRRCLLLLDYWTLFDAAYSGVRTRRWDQWNAGGGSQRPMRLQQGEDAPLQDWWRASSKVAQRALPLNRALICQGRPRETHQPVCVPINCLTHCAKMMMWSHFCGLLMFLYSSVRLIHLLHIQSHFCSYKGLKFEF